MVKKAGPEFFREVEDADGLPDAVQGDTEGLVVGGGLERTVEAHIEEVQPVEDLPLKMLVLVAVHGFPLAGEVAGVAAERGRAQVVLGGQLTVGDPVQQVLVDEAPHGMGADSTAFRHGVFGEER